MSKVMWKMTDSVHLAIVYRLTGVSFWEAQNSFTQRLKNAVMVP